MAAKSLGTPRVIESSVASRQTRGSNHIWKTSSGNSDLKSHLTVSQWMGVRDEEGMDGLGGEVYSHARRRDLPRLRFCLRRIGTGAAKLEFGPSRGVSKEGYT